MNPRPYQRECLTLAQGAMAEHGSTMVVMATGLGKSVVGAHVLNQHNGGRQIWLAHRDVLIAQAAQTIARVTGEMPDIEMADQWADQLPAWQARCIVSSVQTQRSGMAGKGRMTRFPPKDFGILVADECHHSTSPEWRRVMGHYRGNSNLHVLGFTATPNRHDEAALGQIFDSVAYNYGIQEGVRDGWLVDTWCYLKHIESLDLSQCRTKAGDLNGADLARELEDTKSLLAMADEIVRCCAGRKTLIFCASVSHAEKMCEILNRPHYAGAGSARFVYAKTPKDERRALFNEYRHGMFQYLCNVGITTEGWDEPSVESIVMARPTKSAPLYQQMLGRGTRPLPGIVDFDNGGNEAQWRIGHDGQQADAAQIRRQAIADSGKTHCEVIDFCGNSGRHKIVTAVDVLGGTYSDEVLELAKHDAAHRQDCRSADERLQDAHDQIRLRKEHEAIKRRNIYGRAVFTTMKCDPFSVLDVDADRQFGWDKGRPATEKQIGLLEKWGMKFKKTPTKGQASKLIDNWLSRANKGLATYRQVHALRKHGIDAAELKKSTATQLIGMLVANNWRYLDKNAAIQIINECE